MSKKKTKTKVEKAQKVHRLEHIAKSNVFVVKSEISDKGNKESAITKSISPLDRFIRKDLKYTAIIIISFVLTISLLALVVYKTSYLVPLLSHWNISY